MSTSDKATHAHGSVSKSLQPSVAFAISFQYFEQLLPEGVI
jgi:hypothetical protein